jgi:hypothetical protein
MCMGVLISQEGLRGSCLAPLSPAALCQKRVRQGPQALQPYRIGVAAKEHTLAGQQARQQQQPSQHPCACTLQEQPGLNRCHQTHPKHCF